MISIQNISPANSPSPGAALENGRRNGKIVCWEWWPFRRQVAHPRVVKQVYQYLSPYLTNQCQRNPPKEITDVDLHAIAREDTASETMKVGFQLQKIYNSENATDFQRSF